MGRKLKSKEYEPGFNRFSKIVDIKLDPVLMVLKAHLLAEYYIDQFLLLQMPRGDIFIEKGFSFSQKLAVLKAAATLFDEELNQLEALNKVRNRCAHDMEYSISEADIDRLGFPQGKNYFKLKEEFPIEKSKKHLLWLTLIGTIASLEGATGHYKERYKK